MCKHERVITNQFGSFHTTYGEPGDDCETYDECLDCGWIVRDDGTWGPPPEVEEPTKDKLAF